MHLYHPNIPHNFRRALEEISAFNQVKPKLTCLLLGLTATSLSTKKPLLFLVNALTFIKKDKADIHIREKS